MKHRLLALAILATHATVVCAADPHSHGTAFIDMAIDNQQVSMAMRGAGDGFVGFEHAAETADQHNVVNAAIAQLKLGSAMFEFVGSECTQQSSQAEVSGGNHTESGHGHDSHEAHDEHSTWTAAWAFHCTSIETLAAIRLRMLDVFPRLQEVRVQLLTASAQTAAVLTGKSPLLELPTSP